MAGGPSRGSSPLLRPLPLPLQPRVNQSPHIGGDACGVGEAGGGSNKESVRVRWQRGSVERSVSAADTRGPVSERPFFSSRALKVSLLVADLRMLRWMEPEDQPRVDAGEEGGEAGGREDGVGGWAVGVSRGDLEALLPPPRDFSASGSRCPRTFRLDLRGTGRGEKRG